MNLYLFDVDGVVTDKQARPDKALLKRIAKLSHGNKVAFVTGRSLEWMDRLMPFLKNMNPENVIFIGENGNTKRFYVGGDWMENVSAGVPEKAVQAVRDYCKKLKNVFFDETKLTMISVEAKHELPLQDEQPDLDSAEGFMREIAPRYSMFVVTTTYAVDMIHKGAGKRLGASIALRHFHFSPDHVYMFGDSRADLKMDEAVAGPHTLFFVGRAHDFVPKPNRIHTHEKYKKGTCEALDFIARH